MRRISYRITLDLGVNGQSNPVSFSVFHDADKYINAREIRTLLENIFRSFVEMVSDKYLERLANIEKKE